MRYVYIGINVFIFTNNLPFLFNELQFINTSAGG